MPSCEELVAERPLLVGPSVFHCPYCGHQWQRGGHKEGFVKAGAFRHVSGCRQVLLFEKGYVQGQWVDGAQLAIAVAKAHPKQVLSAKTTKRARARSGLLPRLPN